MKNFIKCGMLGWCLECFWTGINDIKRSSSNKLQCQTSIWMFFIYGMACIIVPIFNLTKKLPTLIRGIIYTSGIFGTEYITGSILKKYDACPWDYSNCTYNIKGLIRLDYAPLWFFTGLIYEHLLCKKHSITNL